MAQAMTFTSAMRVVSWEEDWVLGQFARSDASSMWLFGRAKGPTADRFHIRGSKGVPSRPPQNGASCSEFGLGKGGHYSQTML